MSRYKTIAYGYNVLRGMWYAQIGYHYIAETRTEAGIKLAITAYIKNQL